MKKPWVYIASPYTKGDPAINTRFQMDTFNTLMDSGRVLPYAPLWSPFQHLVHPRAYKDWVDYDLEMIEKMDACLRLNASHLITSTGADGEVARFRELNKPVFYSIAELLAWAPQKPD